MRYILNNDGYIFDVSFGADISCDLGDCQQYTGDIPEGYSTLEEWHDAEIDRLNAWKIIDGNLTYDSNKASELEAICNEQAENNRSVTKKELDTALADIGTGGEVVASNSNEIKMMLPIRTMAGKIIKTIDSSSYEVKRIKVTSDSDITNKITLISSTPNLLPNKAVTQTIGGLTLTVNEDKSILVTGNVTDSGAFAIAGTLSNTTPILAFKGNQQYYIAELPSGLTWNLYNYDGSDRELVYTGTGGVIELTENKHITYVEIAWTSDSSISNNITVYPMLNVGNTALEYELHRENKAVIDLGTSTLTPSRYITIENGECNLGTIDRVINTYNPTSVIYAIEDVNLEVDYYKSDLYEKITATGTLHLTNTYAGTGAVNKLVIKDVTAGSYIYLLASTTETGVTNEYSINLKDMTGAVDVVIDKGKVSVLQSGIVLKESNDDIYINTYANDTYLRVDNEPNLILNCEYMLKSTFTDIFCTIVEKNASFKILENLIQLEVKRASAKEGELSSSISLEANKITQIVTAIGNEDYEVTPASIIQAINGDTSTIQIHADKIDITGTKFPSIQNTEGTCSIKTDAEYEGDNAIEYTAKSHTFNGSVYQDNPDDIIYTKGNLYADGSVMLGADADDNPILNVSPDFNCVDVTGDLNVTNNLIVDGIVRLGKITETRGKIMIDNDGNIRMYGDLYVSGIIHGTVE